MNPSRIVLAALSIAAFACACATPRLPKESVMRLLDEYSAASQPSLACFGSVKIKGNGVNFNGSVILAIDGDQYRLEVVDGAGITAVAVAGGSGVMIRLDMNTGAKTILTGEAAKTVHLDKVSAPVSLLKTLVTGAPPPSEKKGEIQPAGTVYKMATSNPSMELELDGERLTQLTLYGEDGNQITAKLGPMTGVGLERHVASARVEAGGGAVMEINWQKVTPKEKFPEGFFSFTEVDE